MLVCAEEYIKGLEKNELNYDVKELKDGDVLVRVPNGGISVNQVFTGEKGEYLSCFYTIENAPEDKVLDAIVMCNTLNMTYKWLKFYVDKSNDVMAEDDAILSEDSAFEEAFELMLRGFKIIKDVKPLIMRSLYA